jgi:hypothetical protein
MSRINAQGRSVCFHLSGHTVRRRSPTTARGMARMGFFLALTLPALGAAGSCDHWRLLLRTQGRDANSLRLSLEYLASPPTRQDWFFYGFAVPNTRVEAVRLGHLDPASLQRLVKVEAASSGKPIYDLKGWYRPDNPLALYLIRASSPQPRLLALGVQVGVARATPLPEGYRYKFHGFVPPKMLIPEPARIDGIEPDVLVCRAYSIPAE